MQRSQKSLELYMLLKERGYPQELCDLITSKLNTDYTAGRMIGYLSYFQSPRIEDLADEMLAILEDRKLIADKHEYFRANAAWNGFLNYGFGDEEDEDES